MKKLVFLLLAAAMCLSLAACGGKDDPQTPSGNGGSSGGDIASTPTPEPAGAKEDSYVNYPAFSGIEIYEAPSPDDVAETAWAFAGGYTDGHSLTDEEAAGVLELYGGTLRIEFPDAKTANMVQGGGTMPGTFKVLNDGFTLSLSFELQGTSYDYVAAFTYAGDADEDLVLVLVSTADPETAFYMALDL